MDEIFALESLAELQACLGSKPERRTQKQLAKLFLQSCLYENAEQWNKAVRLCEALAIVGWGDHEPVQAEPGVFWNGNPETMFFNRFSKPRFVDAIWSERGSGVTMEPGRTSYHSSPDLPGKKTRLWEHPVRECVQDIPLATQRNWIPKNPILIARGISNCYPESEALVTQIEEVLVPALDRKMSPEAYGTAINRIVLHYCLSYADAGVQENYIILDEDVRLSPAKLYARLRKSYSAREIDKNGYCLRKRYDFGGFVAAKGLMKVEIHFPREFSRQSLAAQKQEFATHLVDAVAGAVRRLKAKKLPYDLERMNHDFQTILRAWVP